LLREESREEFVLTAILISSIVGSQFFRLECGADDTICQRPCDFYRSPVNKSMITWVHDNGRSEAHHLPETCGGGGVIFDYDNDGWMDIYLVNSGPSDFYTPKTAIRGALYHNNHDGTFTDVTEKAGRSRRHLWPWARRPRLRRRRLIDLYVTGYGRNILYHNNGNDFLLMLPTNPDSM